MLLLGVNAKLPSSTKHAAIMCVSSTVLETIDPCTSMLHKKLQKEKGNNYRLTYMTSLHIKDYHRIVKKCYCLLVFYILYRLSRTLCFDMKEALKIK